LESKAYSTTAAQAATFTATGNRDHLTIAIAIFSGTVDVDAGTDTPAMTDSVARDEQISVNAGTDTPAMTDSVARDEQMFRINSRITRFFLD